MTRKIKYRYCTRCQSLMPFDENNECIYCRDKINFNRLI